MAEPESSSSRPKGAYDVFLSFRGKDTRKNFTDHLYTALVQAGIHTFQDDNELRRGEEISIHLHKAIHESKISIVVFSKGYASSRWCLNELVEILECKNRNTDHFVLPIFYDIDPSDVRKQTGSFSEAMDKHEECFKEKVKEWRKALAVAGNLSGWNLNDMANGHESKFIQEIIKDVLNKLDPKDFDVGSHIVGIDPLVQNINVFLSNATDDVLIVGIHGMAGIGKTTIAKAVFNKLCYGFEGSSFLLNIKETSEKPNSLVLLQEQLLRDILRKNNVKINNVDSGMVLIKNRLCHKRILVVFDDVVHLNQLNALMGERSWFGPGSRVIITSRDERLLLRVDQPYQVKELKRDESLQLFSWHAFGDIHPKEDYVELSSHVVDYSQGLPLALEVLGSSLFEKNKTRWQCVIDKLRKIPNHDIQEKLKISFYSLDDNELQNTFLDIACFFVGTKKEYVTEVIEARCGFNPEDDLRTLIERSLITINILGEISMHDLLRDMGKEIIREKSPENPGKRSRIWNNEDAWNVLNKQMGTEVVEGLALDVRGSKIKPLSTESFTKMELLKLLKINGVHLTGSFKLLSKELIWLCWLECPIKSLPSDFMLDNLVVLDMQYSNMKELWKKKKILDKLKILNLSYAKNLVKTPNLHSSSLEKLMLEGCSSLVEVHQSIGYLKSLVFLNLEGCCRLKDLPESMGDLKSLKTLNINMCSELQNFPERLGDMESLMKLLANGIAIKQLPSSIGNLKGLVFLNLEGCSRLKDLPESIGAVKSLETLNIKGCSKLENLPERLGDMESLRELLANGTAIQELPLSIGNLKGLVVLNLEGCWRLKIIPESTSGLKFLQTLNIRGCSQLEKLPKSMGDMECLTEVLADGIENEQFLSSVGHLKYVRKLSLRGYNFDLQALPSSTMSWLSPTGLNLNALLPTSFLGCAYLGSLSSLVELDLSGNNFFNLPSGLDCLPTLQILNVEDCRNLVSISELPSSLKELNARNCTSMQRVGLPIQSSLTLLVNGCQNLVEIQGMEGVGNRLSVFYQCWSNLSNDYKKTLVEVFCKYYDRYLIVLSGGEIPDWFSYRGEGCSTLSFHLPPVLQASVLCVLILSKPKSPSDGIYLYPSCCCIKIRSKSSGIQLFEYLVVGELSGGIMCLIRHGGFTEKEMEEYGGQELELYLEVDEKYRNYEMKECGVHVIVEKKDSVEESEWDHEHLGNIDEDAEAEAIATTAASLTDHEQWKNYLLTELTRRQIAKVCLFQRRGRV